MQAWIIASVGLACIATGLFAARPYIRRMYAPPRGRRRMHATWIVAAVLLATSFALGSEHAIAALALFTAGPAIGLMAMLLCRDAYNRARGLPPDHVDIPEQLDAKRRALFAVLGVGCAGSAAWLVGAEGWAAAVHAAWVLGGFAVGFGSAAATGRLSPRMRQRIGASSVQSRLLERPADDL